MKAKRVIYSRLISKGNYENAKIEIELEVEASEKASEVFEVAKKWVEKRIAVEKLSDYTIDKARKVMDDKRNHTLAQIEEAEEILAKVKVSDDELPFQVARHTLADSERQYMHTFFGCIYCMLRAVDYQQFKKKNTNKSKIIASSSIKYKYYAYICIVDMTQNKLKHTRL